ncbi:hypothetical protein [Limnohabitans sp. DM1]|uniref:hypothetical protein n=1 Tax=Limnohabitans sp. DM1 TaxID=1597955 RepID=UPI000A91FDEC|nr:hypothetical protein [Limnohabitans sp. DM1]
MKKVVDFLRHNSRNEVLPLENSDSHYNEWRKQHPTEFVFGPIVKHTWQVDGQGYERTNPRNDGLDVLPDQSGFLLCEKLDRNDNLVLLDAYGQEHMRLSVPWQLTRDPHPEMAAYPSHFVGLTTPWDNPKTGQQGKFAVLAWVQYAGDYAFELDWKTGQFLWGYFLERG